MEGLSRRWCDVVVAVVLLVVVSPLLLLLAFLVRRSSPGPIIYRQVRLGLEGRAFTMLKFRTMRTDAEATTGAVWATASDPRATAVGRWLRRWSLDELPQFWNVLRGDMSMVGPRPERPHFVAKFGRELSDYWRRHDVRPGVTGWAQVNGLRGNTSLQARLACDLAYIRDRSVWLDIWILVRTPFRLHEV